MTTQDLDTTAADTVADAPALDDAAILAIAEAADAGQPAPAAKTAPASDKPSSPADSGEDAKAKSPPKEKTAPNQTKLDPAAAKPGDKPADSKPETAFEKAKKDKARLEKTWENVEKEKAAVRAEALRLQQQSAQFEAAQRELAELKQKAAAAPKGPVKDEAGYTADDYIAAAKGFDAEGDTRLADAARRKAEGLRQKEKEVATAVSAAPSAPAGEAWKTPEFQKKWQAEAAAIVQAEPDLAKPENPVFQAVNTLVNDPVWGRFFRADPTGLRAAVEVAKLQQSAAKVPTLEKELATAREEIARLNKLTSPRGGLPPAPAPGQRRIEDMTPDEADAAAFAAALAADRAA